ncbi:MAG TPA: rod shape-determining protein MreC [Candidatus Faecousia faecavium]|nr:rod shape-determining protein MreC [Candidatus Faecousia faecavium]
MRNLFSTRVKIILVIAALLSAGLAILSGVTNTTVVDLVVQGLLAPFKAAGTALTTTAEKYYGYMFRYEALAAENEVLEERIAQMEDVARQADAVSRENQRLRDYLNLTATNEDYKSVDAYIIGWSSTDWENTLTINRGTNAGIQENMCAITANGEVVGLVTAVGTNWAEVTTVLDSTLEISGTISTSGYNGMVRGGYISDNQTLLQMNYLPSSAIIRNQDQVVTSGSTVYPRGLIMGYVVDAGFEDTGVAKFALLDPAADINALEQIFIITEYTTDVVQSTPDATTATTPGETTPAQTTAPTVPVETTAPVADVG